MAFKILNEEQIALLTDNQREQYENELDMYNARNAFVERMQVLENVEIEPYELKIQGIEVIAEVQFNTFELKEPICVDLPEHSKIENVKVDKIKKPEIVKTDLPKAKKIEAAAKKIETAEIAKVKPDNIPAIEAPDVPGILFAAPQKVELILPETAVRISDIKSFEKIEQPQIEFPTFSKPVIAVETKTVKPAQATLPEVSNIEYTNVEFHRPEIAEAELPTVSKPKAAMHEIVPVKYSVSALPTVRKPETKIKTFKIQKYSLVQEIPKFWRKLTYEE